MKCSCFDSKNHTVKKQGYQKILEGIRVPEKGAAQQADE